MTAPDQRAWRGWCATAVAAAAILLATTRESRARSAEGSSGATDIRHYLPAGQPDGSTDNTEGVQAAVDATQRRGGGEILFGTGTYVIKKVRLYADITLTGAGPGATVFKAAPGMAAADRLTDDGGESHVGYDGVVMFYNRYGDTLANITLRSFTIDGNAAAQSFDGAKNLHGFYLNGVTRVLVENVVVQNCLGFGGILKEATHSIVRDCRFDRNGQNLRPGYWKRGAPPGGNGFDLISRCSDNLVTGTSATGNGSAGFEDEGRLGEYNPVNRNARNRWVNLHAAANRDNGLTLLWADAAEVTNVTVTGGAIGPNAAALQVIGSDGVVVSGLDVRGSRHEGIRVWPEVYGQRGTSRNLTIRNATIIDTAARAIIMEGVRGAKVQAKIRGVGGGVAVELGAAGYGRTLGYGKGAYRTGEAYVARRGSPSGVGTYVVSNGRVYELVVPFAGGRRSVSAPRGEGVSLDNGGVWEFRNTVQSEDVELEVDYDGTVGAQARHGIHAVDPVRLTVRGSSVRGCSDHNIWLEGRPVDPAIKETRSSSSGERGLAISDVRGTLRLSGVHLEGNARPPLLPRGRTILVGSNSGIDGAGLPPVGEDRPAR